MLTTENGVGITASKFVTTTTTLSPSFENFGQALGDKFVYYLNYLEKLPGGPIVLRYIKSSYKNDPVRSLFELGLFLFALKYFLSSKKKENKSEITNFSEREIDELCREWKPEPLVYEPSAVEKWQLKSIPEVTGQNGAHIEVSVGYQHHNLLQQLLHALETVNLASFDFLNLNESEDIKQAAKATIKTCGVGACGPPQFYGSQDVHVRLEEDLAEYLDTELAVLYGQDFVTAGSVLPAFLKRGDLCVVDSGVNLAIQNALIVSRCDIEWYEHNDMNHLEEVLEQLKPVLDKQKPVRRRFIVTEGVFANFGDLALLPRIVELKNEYKFRLFLDETLSVGVIGDSGRGITEYYGIPRSEISITIGSMALSFASSGGFSVGVTPMINHQKIASNAYVFSASLPPYSAKVASQAIKHITTELDSEGKSAIISTLHKKTKFVYNGLHESIPPKYFGFISSSQSPVIHLGLTGSYRDQLGLPPFYGDDSILSTGKQSRKRNQFNQHYNLESFVLQKIIDIVLQRANILLTRSKLVLEHENLPITNPHLLIMINNGVKNEELERLVKVLPKVITEVCLKLSNETDLVSLENEMIAY